MCHIPCVIFMLTAVISLTANSALIDTSPRSSFPDKPPLKLSLSASDLETIPWSRNTTILARRGHQFEYHNYTVIANPTGYDQRWTQRHKRERSALRPRGNGIDSTLPFNGLWSSLLPLQAGGDGFEYHYIKFCYMNNIALVKLRDFMCEASHHQTTAA